jgi:hypothetical protein
MVVLAVSVAVAAVPVKMRLPVVAAATVRYLFGLGDYENSRIRDQ